MCDIRARTARLLNTLRYHRYECPREIRSADLRERVVRGGGHGAHRIRRHQGPTQDHVHRYGGSRRGHGSRGRSSTSRMRRSLPAAPYLRLSDARKEETDLRTISLLAQRYDVIPGLSDHTLKTAVPTAAVALGACVIEKHVALSRKDGNPNAAFSLEAKELAKFVYDTRTAWGALAPCAPARKSLNDPNGCSVARCTSLKM